MITALIPAIVGIVGKVIDKAVPDRTQAESLKAQLTAQIVMLNAEELKQASSIILAEVQGESWLQRNWRPMLMIWFAGLLGLYWFGFAPAYLIENPTVMERLFALLQVGIGGYIVGRSAEKIVKDWKKD
jgi:hypothetical protein